MKPNEASDNQIGAPSSQKTQMTSDPNGQPNQTAHQQAAVNIIRSQIDNIYNNPSIDQKHSNSDLEDINPYDRTYDRQPITQNNQWTQYHTAWQEYYQKYYEGYYLHHLQKAQQTQQINQPDSPNDQLNSAKKTINEQALFDLRQKLLEKVIASTKKIRKSRHFIPIISGVIVVLLFSFIQYNRFLVSNVLAYVSPGSIDPQNIVINPSGDVAVSPEPKLIIPKINVDVPVYYDVGNDYDSQMATMEKGVAHFAIPGANSHPGEIGNTVIAGHSSNDLIGGGDYKFIFVQLEKLNKGDTIYANYNSKRYTYTVTNIEVVKPTDVGKLISGNTDPILTLVTCTPIGTATNRLLITAKQVSPDPSTAKSTTNSNNSNTKSIPGTSPTLLERIFGINSN